MPDYTLKDAKGTVKILTPLNLNSKPTPVESHWRRWGFVWLLLFAFLVSWSLQLVAMLPEVSEKGWHEFWAATFENWQSEFLQLVVQAVLIQSWLFRYGFKAKDE
ncbi:hypothetical protein HWB99_gp013 [Mycobacterium phage DrLupo]|uniref:Holin n=1 Tax=Mycobacterium phage DrLupo TaxID=2499037 RepID=A0A3S9UQH4_9CAUD|nr:hypothetical protein HWB99_gp013 [Mycobacterium phage DrLupo]AZS12549.1 hypothetical protein SEA_DRLUPO_13 [Mycobacterium phage DrLupo]